MSVHHGGGVGIGNSIHAGLVIVADGSEEMDERLSRVLTNDPGIGVARHADAGYEEAIETAHAARPAPARWRTDRVAGRTAVLTGVTGGWGRAVLDRFLAQGWDVCATTHSGGVDVPSTGARASRPT